MNETATYFHLQTLTAPKTSLNAKGGITYAILKDSASTEVYFTLLANEGGSGYFGREIIPFANIQACLDGVQPLQPIPAKRFRNAFSTSKSVNNGGFLVAALRHQSLLKPAPDVSHQHVIGDDWDDWKTRMLAMESAEVFGAPVTEQPVPSATPESIAEPAERKKSKKAGKRDKTTAAENANTEGGDDDQPA
jgi:hypothetical protein